MNPINETSEIKLSEVRIKLECIWLFLSAIAIFFNSTIWEFSIAIFVIMTVSSVATTKYFEEKFNGEICNILSAIAGGAIAWGAQQGAQWFNIISRGLTDRYAQGAEYLNVDLNNAPIETVIKVTTETFIEAPFLLESHVVIFALLTYLIPIIIAYPLWKWKWKGGE